MRVLARLVALMLVVGAVALAPSVPAAADGDAPRDDLRAVGPDPVEPGFPILGVGVAFDLPSGVAAASVTDEPEIRFRRGDAWGAWQHLEAEHADGRLWSSALTAASGADAYQVRGLPDAALDARAYAVAVEPVSVGTASALSTAAATGCMTREEWGAAPPRGSLASAPSSARLRVLTVHHTADTASSRTSVQWVRAIQGWHQNGNGWDDIGYQVLIDPSGVVFEGRWSGRTSRSCALGGTAVTFGHVGEGSLDVVTGAHVGGWNTGNLGVSLLGTFTGGLPTSAARDALVAHLASVTDRHGIDPTGTVTLTSGSTTRTVPRIIGHRDLGATECPGNAFYAHLPTIRDRVAAFEPPEPEPEPEPMPPIVLLAPATADATVMSPTESGLAVSFAASLEVPLEGVTWRWTDARNRRVASTSGFERTLGPGTHRFAVTATDPVGRTASQTVTVTVVPERLTDLPRKVSARPGRASGRVRVLAEEATGTVVLQERVSGKRAAATSALDARFALRVRGGSTVDLVLDAEVPVGVAAEGFRVEHSMDGGRTFEALGTLASGSSGRRTFPLPATLTGAYVVRIVDSDRSPGERTLDTVRLSHLGVHSRNVAP